MKTISDGQGDGLIEQINGLKTKPLSKVIFNQQLDEQAAIALSKKLTAECAFGHRQGRLIVEVDMSDNALNRFVDELTKNDSDGQDITRYLQIKIINGLNSIKDMELESRLRGMGYMQQSMYSHYTSTSMSNLNRPSFVRLFDDS